MPNYLFDIRLNASIRLDADTPEQARAMIKEALECCDVNAGSWPDGSPILFEASLDHEDTSDEDAMALIEVDGEDPEAVDPPPLPSWAAPLSGSVASQGAALNAAMTQARAAYLNRHDPIIPRPMGEDISPTLRDALIYGMGAELIATTPATMGIDRAEGPDQTLTVLMIRIDPKDMINIGPDELELLSAELRDAIDAARQRTATSRGTTEKESPDV